MMNSRYSVLLLPVQVIYGTSYFVLIYSFYEFIMCRNWMRVTQQTSHLMATLLQCSNLAETKWQHCFTQLNSDNDG